MKSALKILYVHGYLGSGNGHSSQLIRNEFDSRAILCEIEAPSFPVVKPIETKEMIKRLVEKNHYDYIVASSLGAFYCMQIPGIKKVLVNIALPENLERIRDSAPEQHQHLSQDFIEELKNEKEMFFSTVFDDDYKHQTYVIYGVKDGIAPNENFLGYYFDDESRVLHIDMEHKLNETGANSVFEVICRDSHQCQS